MRYFIFLLLLASSAFSRADAESMDVEDNVRAMDTDRDGQVTVSEMRAYLEAQHGKGYKQALLEDMEVKAGLKSCGSPFSKSLY
jgi:Ca2+-binding EF-hand superfamily protein